jgi:23S rRNA (guanosine2251-2'-O)-methyltransferase
MSENKDKIVGRNPVLEALRSGREVDRLLVQEGAEGSIGKILSLAKERKVPVSFAKKTLLDQKARGSSHQGVIAYVSAYRYASLDDVFRLAESRGEAPFLILLDEVEDPHNLGAIMRTAECAGAHGVVITKRRASGLTETVAKASAGAVEYVPCVRVNNMARTIEELQQRGVWVYACDMDGTSYYEQDMKGPCALVIGNEGAGISRLVREKCDFIVSIPMVGRISSLNASNAAAILMYEIRKQRDGK